MNILLTGATGLLGKHVSAWLSSSKNKTIWGISRNKGCQNPNVNYIYGDIRDPKIYQSLPAKIDICIHTAASIPAKEDLAGQQDCIETNIKGTFELIRFLSNECADVHLIHISTICVYGESINEVKTEDSIAVPSTFYGLSKLFSEAIVLKSDLRACVLRLASLYDDEGTARKHQGLLYEWIDRAKYGKDLVVWGMGQGRRNYLHIEDAVNAVALSIEKHATGIYNIASHENLTLLEIAKLILRAANSTSNIIIDSSKSAYAPLAGVSIQKMINELNFSQKISLEMGIKRILSISDSNAH